MCKFFFRLFATHYFTNFINEHISRGATPVLIHLFMSQLHYIFRRWPRFIEKMFIFHSILAIPETGNSFATFTGKKFAKIRVQNISLSQI